MEESFENSALVSLPAPHLPGAWGQSLTAPSAQKLAAGYWGLLSEVSGVLGQGTIWAEETLVGASGIKSAQLPSGSRSQYPHPPEAGEQSLEMAPSQGNPWKSLEFNWTTEVSGGMMTGGPGVTRAPPAPRAYDLSP